MTASALQKHTGDQVLGALLFKYFTLAKSEDMPQTPKITAELDALEMCVRDRCEKLQAAA